MMERVLLKDPDWRNAPYVWEDEIAGENIYKFVSFAAAYPNRIMSVKEFIDWLVCGAETILMHLANTNNNP